MLKSLARSFLSSRGLELKPIGAPIRGPYNYIRHIKSKGFAPGTVIDIGVATGTPWLYQFPRAKLVLVEPNPEFQSDLERISAEHGADILPFAAGVKPGVLNLNVDLFAPSSSGFLPASEDLKAHWRSRGQTRPIESRKVDVRPLDAMIGERYPGPYLIKIDTEDFELEVLKGATETLTRAERLVVETSVARRHEGSYAFADLIGFLAEQGFAFSDILDIQTFNRDGDISYMDVAFVRTSEHVPSGADDPPNISRFGGAAA